MRRALIGTMVLVAGVAAAAGIGQAAAENPPPAHAAAPEPAKVVQTAAEQALGQRLYQERCAGCHENPTDRAPSRTVLSKNPVSFILGSLRNGAMAPMAEGLSLDEMVAIARYVSKVPEQEMTDINPSLIWGSSVEGTPLDAPLCDKPARPVNLAHKDQWNGWSPTKDNARFQRNPGFDARDVGRLKLKWAFKYPGAKNGQATVIGDRLFTTSMSGAVYALNARTGCVYWRYAGEAATRSSVTIAALPKGAPAKHALFLSDWTKSAVALDPETGKILWKTVVDDQPGLQMTGAPTYWDGKLFVPISSGNEAFAQSPNWVCCKFRGALVALDAVTGKILWKRYTTDQEPRPFKVNKAGKQMWGPSGGAIWVAPTIDARRRLIYVGTSNSYTDVPYDNADSVLAIEVDTGRIRWARQLTANDNYIDGCRGPEGKRPANCPSPVGPDWSIGAAVILQPLPNGGDILLVGQKSGMMWALDPANDGAVKWRQQLSRGSELGGIEFGTASDGRLVYAGVSDIVLGRNGKPGLWAMDIATGKVIWNQPTSPTPKCRWEGFWCHGALSQAISVMPGLVFAGSYDGHFRAYDTRTGEVRWDFDTGSRPVLSLKGEMVFGGVMDGGGPTIAGGMVYVHSGYAGRSGATAGRDMLNADGNVLMAFSIDGK